jgi:hypothetical protein
MLITAEQLMPLFEVCATDDDAAHSMALSAIAGYAPESRADYVNIARTIAFSMAALTLLGHATADVTMMPPEKMRAYGRANALNISADQSERTMMQRRKYHHAHPPAKLPAWMDPCAEPAKPEPPIDDAGVAEAMREYINTTGKPKAPVSEPAAAPNHESVASPVQPRATAIHYNAPKPGTARSKKASLLQNCAMPCIAEQGIAQRIAPRTHSPV